MSSFLDYFFLGGGGGGEGGARPSAVLSDRALEPGCREVLVGLRGLRGRAA